MRRFASRLREAKSVRAFAFEVLIVVVGVLIALGAQQLVEDWTWRQKVAAGEQRLKDEADDTVFDLAEQIVVAPCVDAQLAQLDAKLRAPGPWTGTTSYPSSTAIPAVIRAPVRSTPTDLWNTLGAEGTALHFEAERAQSTETYYRQLQGVVTRMAASEELRSQLAFLVQPAELSPDARANLLGKISAIRHLNAFQALGSTQLMGRLHELGRMKSIAALKAEMNGAAATPASTIDVCRRQGLPLGDWEAALSKQIADNRAYDARMKNAPK